MTGQKYIRNDGNVAQARLKYKVSSLEKNYPLQRVKICEMSGEIQQLNVMIIYYILKISLKMVHDNYTYMYICLTFL